MKMEMEMKLLRILAKILRLLCFFIIISGSRACPTATQHKVNENLLAKALEMRSYMNESANPCENFFEFACGNWSNVHPAASNSEMETNYLLLIKEAFDKKVLAMLEDPNDRLDTKLDKQVRNFYRSCMKLRDGVAPEKVLDVIAEFGKMPALLNATVWDEDQFDWVETLAKIVRTYGISVIVGFGVMPDVRDNSINRVIIGETKLDLGSKSMYLDDVGDFYRMVYTAITALKMNKLLGMDADTAETTAEEVMAFETSLAKGMMDIKSDRNLNTVLINTTIEELQRKYAPTFDVKKYVNIILGEIPNDMVYEFSPTYLTNVVELMKKTKKRIVANYIFYHLIKTYYYDTENTKEDFQKECLDKVKENFPKNIDNMIYRRNGNSEQIENDLQSMWQEMKSLFKVKLQSSTTLDWMSPETRQKAMTKLEAVKLEINSYNDWDFTMQFAGLEIDEKDFIENYKNILKLEAKRNIAKLHEPGTALEAGKTLSFTPTNILTENTVKIPVALLQPYYVWATDFPAALKFGITGFLLAHELMHAFDETGRQFGKYGNLEEWWDQKSVQAYEQRRECFIEQYHRYIFGENPLPRSTNQAENIADNSGLKLAYEAYMKARNNANQLIESADQLPEMPYTNKQIFFIAYSQFFCSDSEGFLKTVMAETDTHTPYKYRIIGTLSNLKEFAETFECKAGSQMNPMKKCEMY